MHVFGVRKDEVTEKLFRVLPNSSSFGMWLCLFPWYVKCKIAGKMTSYPAMVEAGTETIMNLVTNRTFFFDQIIEKSKNEFEQFVVMGAGFDTRCYGDLKNSNLTFFELDQSKTQQMKIGFLKQAGVDTSNVNFVEVDFQTEHWYEKLENAGYDPKKKTIFLWEGVTLYLGEQDVRNTLKEITQHSTSGSIVVADIYSTGFVTGKMYPGMKTSMKALKITDEAFGFGLDFSQDYQNTLKTFLEEENTKMGETHFMGYKSKKGVYVVVTEILI